MGKGVCVFYPFGELSAILIKYEIVVCKLFQLGRVLKLLFERGLNKCIIHLTHSHTMTPFDASGKQAF